MRLNFASLSKPIQKTGGQVGTLGTASNHAALSRPHLPGNAGDTWGQVPATVIEGQDEKADLSPMSPSRPQPWGHGKPCIYAAVPIVPNVPTKKHKNEIDREAFEDRAAIIEFDGGLSRAEAERLATESLGVMPPSNQPAEQVAQPKQRPAPGQACQDCQHFARPGLSDGYCAERTDLPLAYGQNHPLHELPGDKGASCDKWQIARWLVGYDPTDCKSGRSGGW